MRVMVMLELMMIIRDLRYDDNGYENARPTIRRQRLRERQTFDTTTTDTRTPQNNEPNEQKMKA